MSGPIRIAITDDLEMHRSMLRMNLTTYGRDHGCEFVVVGEYANGRELLDGLAGAPPELISLDIRMPVMDGLTALLHLRKRLRFAGPIVMVSSEEESNIDRFFKGQVSDKVRAMPIDQKLANMAKVEERVLAGQREEGKINDLLPGCEKLRLDPIEYARHLGANGFLHKPYTPEQTTTVLDAVLGGGSYLASR